MNIYPKIENFKNKYNKKENQLVWSILSADLETPISVVMKLELDNYYCLLESVEKGINRSRYSFIALDPDILWKSVDGVAKINNNAQSDKKAFLEDEQNILDSLRKIINDAKIEIPKSLPSLAYGVFGYMGYDMVQYMEDVPCTGYTNLDIADSFFIRPKIVIIFDSVKDDLIIVTPVFYNNNVKDIDAYNSAKDRINNIVKKLEKPIKDSAYEQNLLLENSNKKLEYNSNTTYEEFCNMVKKAKEYILDGDIFQVVLSQRFDVDFPYSEFTLYRVLRRLNPSPFSFYLKLDDMCLVGSSPEILVSVKDKNVTVRPIAGTRPRGRDYEEDTQLTKDLNNDPKELSEHLMLLDLGRNDVGRVADIGSVKVTENTITEYFSHVIHLTSKVEGVLKNDKDALDALICSFPAGTVSGAPKIRAMQIIDELEKDRRKYYAGGVGCFSANGDLETCIALRTGLIYKNKLYIQAGAGIVADSVADSEYKECCNKAMAILKAADIVKYNLNNKDS